MKKVDFVKMGFKNLWRRKLRTILTIMGVVIRNFFYCYNGISWCWNDGRV